MTDEIEELRALAWMNDTLKGPSFVLRLHWRLSGYATMVRRGLVAWGDPPEGFDRRKFAGTTITQKGRDYLAALEIASALNSAAGEG